MLRIDWYHYKLLNTHATSDDKGVLIKETTKSENNRLPKPLRGSPQRQQPAELFFSLSCLPTSSSPPACA